MDFLSIREYATVNAPRTVDSERVLSSPALAERRGDIGQTSRRDSQRREGPEKFVD
jgi:hypothetical protein